MVCDFQARYHLRIDPEVGDFAGLSASQFFRYATRLPTYEGAVAYRLEQFNAQREGQQPAAPMPAAGEAPQTAQMIEATPENLLTNPLLAQYIEYG